MTDPFQVEEWMRGVKPLLRRVATPFYLFSLPPLRRALAEMDRAFAGLPIRTWLSFKTQPLRPLVQWWQGQNRGIEVVSEFELQAAIREGFAPDQILVNGPAKHEWLPRHPLPGLRVNFDSMNEARVLAPLARREHWQCGVRLLTRQEFDPETPQFPTQFGCVGQDLLALLKLLRRERIVPEIVHFHLRSNVASAAIYDLALQEVAEVCRRTGLAPAVIDLGGGFPPPQVARRDGGRIDQGFRLADVARVYRRVHDYLPSVREIWLENGRWLSARSGILVVRILESKSRRGMRHLICDGGRTLHALVATWEDHELLSIPQRSGPTTLTTVVGPTCMAFDQLARRRLPRTLQAGDFLLWLDAGAYHLPWETQFSHGRAAVFWHDGRRTRQVRNRQSFSDWWGQWR